MTPAIALFLAACGTAPSTPAPEPTVAPAPVEPLPAPAPAASPTLTVTTAAGDVTVTPVYHGTVRIQHGATVIWVDPWSKAPLTDAHDATLVLITDLHPDHLDTAAMARVSNASTQVVAPMAVALQLGDAVQHVLANGQSTVIDAVTIAAVPMYNLTRGPEPGKLFHDKGRGNGYLITIGDKTIYVAGDTECIPEMEALTGVELALLPMNLPYTMTPEEAAGCVKAFKPVHVTPYHYGDSDLTAFTGALAGVEGVTVTLVDAYPGGLPF